MRLDIQTLIKVGGGSNPILFKLDFLFDVMAKQTPYPYSADDKEIILNTLDFASGRRKTGLRYH